MKNPITIARQIIDTANAAHPENFDRAHEVLLTILPAPAVAGNSAGFSVHIMNDGSAVEVGDEWFCVVEADKVSAENYETVRVLEDNQSAVTYGDYCFVAAMGAGGVATAYGKVSTALASGDNDGRAATGVDGRAVSLTAQGLLRGEAGSILTWLLDTCAESVTLKVGRGEAGVAGEWYRLGDDGKPCLVRE